MVGDDRRNRRDGFGLFAPSVARRRQVHDAGRDADCDEGRHHGDDDGHLLGFGFGRASCVGLFQCLTGIGRAIGRAVRIDEHRRRIGGDRPRRVGRKGRRLTRLRRMRTPEVGGLRRLRKGGARFGIVLNGAVAHAVLDLAGAASEHVFVHLRRNRRHGRAHEDAHDGPEYADLGGKHHRGKGRQTGGNHLNRGNIGKERRLLLLFGRRRSGSRLCWYELLSACHVTHAP